MKLRKCPKCFEEFTADNAQVIHCWPCRTEQSVKRAKAHSQVQNAVRLGTLERQPCEICGNRKSIAHHDDYDLPLKVRWLCHACHQQHHAKIADKPIEIGNTSMPTLPDHRPQALRELARVAGELKPHRLGIDRGFEPNRNDIADFQGDLLLIAHHVDRVIEAYGEYLQSLGIVTEKDVHDYFRHQLNNALDGNATFCIERGIEARLETVL